MYRVRRCRSPEPASLHTHSLARRRPSATFRLAVPGGRSAALPPAGNAPPPAPGRSPVAGAVLRPRVDRPIPIVVAEVPRLSRRDPVAAPGTAHQSSVHESREIPASPTVKRAIAALFLTKSCHVGEREKSLARGIENVYLKNRTSRRHRLANMTRPDFREKQSQTKSVNLG
jgi:hypothetical protein